MTFTNSANAIEEKSAQSRATGKLLGVPAPKHLKIGRTIRYKDIEIEAWIASLDSVTEEAA